MSEKQIKKVDETLVNSVLEIENSLLGETSREKILSTFSNENLNYYALIVDGQVVGFYEISIIFPEAEIFDIAIKEEFQGKGFGSFLLDHIIDDCKKQGVDTIFLEVNSMNNKAINLYEKFGFERYSVRKNYYGENDAILMKLQL